MSLTAYIRYDNKGRIVPGGPIVTSVKPKVGDWVAISDVLVTTTPPNYKLRAFVRYINRIGGQNNSNKYVAGSLILQQDAPKDGNWKEVYFIKPCESCNTTTTSTTSSSTTSTTSSTSTTTTTTTTQGPTPVFAVLSQLPCNINTIGSQNIVFTVGTNVCSVPVEISGDFSIVTGGSFYVFTPNTYYSKLFIKINNTTAQGAEEACTLCE